MQIKIATKSLYSSKKILIIIVICTVFSFFLIKFLNFEKYEISFQIKNNSLDEVEKIVNSTKNRNNLLYNGLFMRRVAVGIVEVYFVTQDKVSEGKFFLNNIRNDFYLENAKKKNDYIDQLLRTLFLFKKLENEKNLKILNQEFFEYQQLMKKDQNFIKELQKNIPHIYDVGELKINIINENFVTKYDILNLILFLILVYTFFNVFFFSTKKK